MARVTLTEAAKAPTQISARVLGVFVDLDEERARVVLSRSPGHNESRELALEPALVAQLREAIGAELGAPLEAEAVALELVPKPAPDGARAPGIKP